MGVSKHNNFQFISEMLAACSRMFEWIWKCVRIYGNSVHPIVFLGSKDCHVSLNAGWIVKSISRQSTNITKIGRADAVNTVLSQYDDFESDLMLWSVENITDYLSDLAELCRTNNESRSSVQDHLKSQDFSFSRLHIEPSCSNRCD